MMRTKIAPRAQRMTTAMKTMRASDGSRNERFNPRSPASAIARVGHLRRGGWNATRSSSEPEHRPPAVTSPAGRSRPTAGSCGPQSRGKLMVCYSRTRFARTSQLPARPLFSAKGRAGQPIDRRDVSVLECRLSPWHPDLAARWPLDSRFG
jgi:hypothetical protein